MSVDTPLPLPEFNEQTVSIIRGTQAEARLAELSGLNVEDFAEALMSGHQGAARATGAHAKNAAGTFRWHDTLAALRATLAERGWNLKDEKNAPRAVSPDGKTAVMVVTGNIKTGTKDSPSNATPKGNTTESDVKGNNEGEQLQLEGMAELAQEQRPKTWVFLYFYSQNRNHIRAELSLPSSFDQKSGMINKWEERIILPIIEFGADDVLIDAQPDETPEIDFEIGNEEAS